MIHHCCEKTQCSEQRWRHALSRGSLPTWGGWKMTNHKRARVSLGLRPQNVKSLLRVSREERESAHKAAAQPCCVCGCCFLLARTCLACSPLALGLLRAASYCVSGIEACVLRVGCVPAIAACKLARRPMRETRVASSS